MLIPAYLKEGDLVGIVSPSRKISPGEIEKAVQIIEEWGMRVITGRHAFKGDDQFAGTDEQRAEDFQQMLDNSEVKAIFCSRGGYGSVRIIDKLDFRGFAKSPKWIAGFSDITVFHSHINKNHGVATLHCEMPINFGKADSQKGTTESILRALTSEMLSYNSFVKGQSVEGCAEGLLTGGNLSVLFSLLGSVSDIDTDGRILFLEDLDEYLYHIDRMIMALKRAGKFNNIKGLVVGGMSDMRDNTISYGKTAEEIILEHTGNLGIPVLCNFPAGHLPLNVAMKFGVNVSFEVRGGKYFLEFKG
jgi:muramoyltetrapeptide carboxypeptidase